MGSRSVALLLALGLLGACGGPTTAPVRFGNALPERVPGLAACTDEQPERIDLEPGEPLVLLVHGCFSSGGRFRSLASVFELQGQKTICFNYDDRDSISRSAAQLVRVLRWLHRNGVGELTILGHSQGGLVARLALARLEPAAGQAGVRLVTVSSPFGGVRAARHCAYTALHVLSFGLTVGICHIVTGADWMDLPPGSRMVERPEPLPSRITEHLTIVTDERNSCRRRRANGTCAEDDYVFSIKEQTSERLAADPRTRLIQIVEGHAAIVGQGGQRPQKLIDALVREGVLKPIPTARAHAFFRAVDRIYR